MSAAKSKQDEELDQKIAEIRKKNEAILKRKMQIEEDRKFAEQMNAVVQLRPSTDDWPRERTPALRPSNREIRNEFTDRSEQTPNESITPNRRRNNTETRGRGEGSRGSNPPPDPVSFLADPERDLSSVNAVESVLNRDNRDVDSRRRGDGQRRGRGRGRGRYNKDFSYSPNDEAWREERYKIDEARVRRQKGADGKWRREWDNEKIDLESNEEQMPSLTSLSSPVPGRSDHWKNQQSIHDSRDGHTPNLRGRGYGSVEFKRGQNSRVPRTRSRGFFGDVDSRRSHENMHRGRGFRDSATSNSPPSRGRTFISGSETRDDPESNSRVEFGKRRGNLMDNGNFKLCPEQSPTRIESAGFSVSPVVNASVPLTPPPPPLAQSVPDKNISSHSSSKAPRIVSSIGDSFQVIVPNIPTGDSSSKKEKIRTPRRGRFQDNESRVLAKSQRSKYRTSQSSYSEDEEFKGNSREKRVPDSSTKVQSSQFDDTKNNPTSNLSSDISDCLPKLPKPPLPPFKTSLPKSNIVISKDLTDGDESWEDATTSGTESVGEDYSSLSPIKQNPENDPPIDMYTSEDFIKQNLEDDVTDIFTPEDFIKQNTENDPTDIYKPEDFIKLIKPDDKSHSSNSNLPTESIITQSELDPPSDITQSIPPEVIKDVSPSIDQTESLNIKEDCVKNDTDVDISKDLINAQITEDATVQVKTDVQICKTDEVSDDNTTSG